MNGERLITGLKGLLLALFLTAGYFKQDPRIAWLPVDLTLLSAIAVAAWCLVAFAKSGFRLPRGLGTLIALFTVLLLPVLWTEATPYAAEKVAKFFSFTFLAAIAPLLLLREEKDWRAFFHAFAALGLLLSADAAATVFTSGGVHRVSAFGSNTISLGRGVGVAFVWFALMLLERRGHPALLAPIICYAGVLLLFSGSRGPFLSALGILVLVAWGLYRRQPRKLLIAAGMGTLVAGALAAGAAFAPWQSTERIQSFVSGELGASELARIDFYEASWDRIQREPLGLGWGGFAAELGEEAGNDREYPHNLFLEVGLEAGWGAGLLLLAVLAVALRRGCRDSTTAEHRAGLALCLFFLSNAMVSGDVNDNKALFCFMAMLLSLAPRRLEPPRAAREAA